jgi:pimeloyl-ACP methyl ester carboxylesterase
MLLDYPPLHMRMTEEWAENSIRDYLIPQGRLEMFRAEAIRGLQRDSDDRLLTPPASLPLLVMRGLRPGSLLPDDKLAMYLEGAVPGEVIPSGREGRFEPEVLEFASSAHDAFSSEPDALIAGLRDWLARHDGGRPLF